MTQQEGVNNLVDWEYLRIFESCPQFYINHMYHFQNLNSEQKSIFLEYKRITNSYQVDLQKWGEIMEENPFILHTDSFFPNNFLSEIDLKNKGDEYLEYLEEFRNLVNDVDSTERNLLNFISDDKLFIAASIMKNFTLFGHHDRYIFKEFELPPHFICDYLVVGKNSDGYHFLLIEFESIYKNVTIAEGDFGSTIRKGLNQIDDWKMWMDTNFPTLTSNLKRFKNNNETLPDEFNDFDSTRFTYCVVAGRRDDFTKKTYRKVRELNRNYNIILTHYDKLIEESEMLIKSCRY